MKNVFLQNWHIVNDLVLLSYSDGSAFFVQRQDFNRAFGTIINSSRDDIRRDFAVSLSGDVLCSILN